MYNNELHHHGVKGQRWGVRRYQNYDGSVTTEGKHHAATKNPTERVRNESDLGTLRVILGKQRADKIMEDPIARQNVKHVKQVVPMAVAAVLTGNLGMIVGSGVTIYDGIKANNRKGAKNQNGRNIR